MWHARTPTNMHLNRMIAHNKQTNAAINSTGSIISYVLVIRSLCVSIVAHSPTHKHTLQNGNFHNIFDILQNQTVGNALFHYTNAIQYRLNVLVYGLSYVSHTTQHARACTHAHIKIAILLDHWISRSTWTQFLSSLCMLWLLNLARHIGHCNSETTTKIATTTTST